jgi:GNAT superfamily N-acetyltransferase
LTEARFSKVQKLASTHDVSAFDCGSPALNQFLQRFALVNQKANSAQTCVSCEEGSNRVAGFYSLAVGSVEQTSDTGRLGKGLAGHPVPVMILARLAGDQRFQGVGLGRALLKDALLRTAQAAEIAGIAGIRAILVHAKDDATRNWYLQWGFEPSPTDPYHLYLLIKDLLALLK